MDDTPSEHFTNNGAPWIKCTHATPTRFPHQQEVAESRLRQLFEVERATEMSAHPPYCYQKAATRAFATHDGFEQYTSPVLRATQAHSSELFLNLFNTSIESALSFQQTKVHQAFQASALRKIGAH